SSKAAAYSPTFRGSTIGADGLNFPVRDGKGCAPSPWPPKILVGSGRYPVILPTVYRSLPTLFYIKGQCAKGAHGKEQKEEEKRAEKRSFRPPGHKGRGGRAQAYGQLVPLGYGRCRPSTCGLSTWSSPTAL